MVMKYLFNILGGISAIYLIYWLFYFSGIPKLIKHYGKIMARRKLYDKEIDKINKKSE